MRLTIIAACLLAGLGAAYTITASATGPVTLPDLPGLGYSLGLRGEPVGGVYCNDYYVLSGNGAPETLIGDLPPSCSTAAQEQQRIDALLADFPPPGATPVTTTVYVTTAADPLPAVTTTVAADPLPAITVATPPVEHTVTVTQTVTVAAAPVDVVAPWMVALAVRSQGMNDVFGLA